MKTPPHPSKPSYPHFPSQNTHLGLPVRTKHSNWFSHSKRLLLQANVQTHNPLFHAPSSVTLDSFDKLRENNLGKTLFKALLPTQFSSQKKIPSLYQSSTWKHLQNSDPNPPNFKPLSNLSTKESPYYFLKFWII